LAYNAPKELKDLLDNYYDYDAGENVQSIMEKLREGYVMFGLKKDFSEDKI